MLAGIPQRVRALGDHLLSTPTTPASVGTIAHALRDRRGHLHDLPYKRTKGYIIVDAVAAPRWRQEQPQLPPRGGSVASSPGTERMHAGAGRGGHPAARGASARALELGGRFGAMCAIGHVGGSAYRKKCVTRSQVIT